MKSDLPQVAAPPVVSTPAASAPLKGLGTGAFTALYKSVGEQLKAYEQTKGSDAASELWNRYRRIVFAQAMASQDVRDEDTPVLARLRADMARH